MHDIVVIIAVLLVFATAVVLPVGLLVYSIIKAHFRHVFATEYIIRNPDGQLMYIDGEVDGYFICCGCGKQTHYDMIKLGADMHTNLDDNYQKRLVIKGGQYSYLEPMYVVCDHCGAKFVLRPV